MQPLARAKVASLGEVGAAWVESLPTLIGRLERRWSVRCPGGTGLPGGSTSYVSRVRHADGRELVLKISIPSYPLAAEAAALRDGAGEGYARLESFDEAANALLMESLGSALERPGLTVDEQLDVLVTTLRRAWRPAAGIPTKARSLAADVAGWGSLDDPVVVAALAAAARLDRARDPAELVWVHGDPHPGNLPAVLSPREGAPVGYAFVDPDPFVDVRGYDLGVALRDWCGVLAAAPDPAGWLRQRCVRLGAATGVDPDEIWDWAYLERVSTGLYVTSFGADRLGRTFLDSAALLL